MKYPVLENSAPELSNYTTDQIVEELRRRGYLVTVASKTNILIQKSKFKTHNSK